jgi:hypothetical protein
MEEGYKMTKWKGFEESFSGSKNCRCSQKKKRVGIEHVPVWYLNQFGLMGCHPFAVA